MFLDGSLESLHGGERLVAWRYLVWNVCRIVPGMAYRLNLADHRLPIFDQSRLLIADILLVLSFTDTNSRNCQYIGGYLAKADNR